MSGRNVHLELLLGRHVLGTNGRPVGRLQEVCAERHGSELAIAEYHIGTYGALERFAGSSIGRTILHLFGLTHGKGGYRVPWDKLDISDPDHPRLTCAVEDLLPLEPRQGEGAAAPRT